jgi:hypothetical protein
VSAILDSLAKISTPLGVAGVALLVVLVIARKLLTPALMPQLAKSHAFTVIKMLIDRSFLLAALAVILGFLGYLASTLWAPALVGSATLSDVLIDKKSGKSAVLDFRVVNGTKNDLLVTKIRLTALDRKRTCVAAPLDYSEVYKFHNIGGLDPTDDEPEDISVSQVITAGKSDRFGVEVGDTHPGCFANYWKLKASLVTSAGVIGGHIVELTLD